MLLEFSLQNYRVFKSKASLNLVAQKSCKDQDDELIRVQNFDQLRIQPFAVLYGDNGAGKSIFFEALSVLIALIKLGIVQSNDAPRLEPFLLDDAKRSQPCRFELSFIGHNGCKYHCVLATDNQRVQYESLYSVSKKGARARKLFVRDYDNASHEYEFHFGTIKESNKRLAVMTQELYDHPRSTLLGLLALGEYQEITELVGHLVTSTFAVPAEKADTFLGQHRAQMFSILTNNGNKVLKEQFLDLLNQFDLNIADIKVSKHDLPPQALNRHRLLLQELDMEYNIEVYHDTPWGISESMPFHHFSRGDRKVIGLLCFYVLCAQYKHTCLLAIDELESSIHPKTLIKLKALFSDNKTQLLISSNSPFLLSQPSLRRDQVWFIEKSSNLASDLYPLWDFAPKAGDDLATQWLSGGYSNR